MIFKRKNWLRERFVTLMVIPERTHRVHKVVVPFFLLKVGLILFSLSFVFLVVVGIDYMHVLSRLSENKSLKGENFKLRQEVQSIKNKVETMETTLERVRNYAKKLQMMTGQGDKNAAEIPWGPTSEGEVTAPSKKRANKSFDRNLDADEDGEGQKTSLLNNELLPLEERVAKLELVSASMENNLSRLQVNLLRKSAIMNATPSIMPIAGWVSSTFGYRNNPYDGVYRLHSGIDIAADPGTPVRAPADGTVIFSGYREGYGKAVVVDHGYGIHSLFAHNSVLFVSNGSKIKRGETIAQVGSTGHSTGPHLHYEIRKNGVPVNPAHFLSRARF